jgi:hypothetical protein
LTELGLDRQLQRKFTESESVAREALASTLKYRSDDWQRFQAEILLGASLAGQKRYAEAEPLLLEGSQKIISRKNRRVVPDPYYLDYAHEWLGPLYRATGQPGKSADRSLAQ